MNTAAVRSGLAWTCLALLALLLAAMPLRWASASLLVATLIALTAIRPAVGLAIIALMIPFGELAQLPGLPANGVDVLVGVVVASWLATGAAKRRIKFHRPALMWPLLIFVWCAASSLTQAASWHDGLPEILKWVEFAALYLVAVQILDRRSATWVLICLLAAGVAQAVLGAYQFTHQVGPEAFILPGGYMRAHGTFRQPNPYAGYLGYLFPVVASLGLSALSQWQVSRKPIHLALLAACGAVAGVLGLGITVSWSRGAWLGLIAGGIVVVALRSKRSAALAAGIAIIVVLVVIIIGTGWMPQAIAARVNDLGAYLGGPDPARTEINDANFAVMERLAHWRAGQQMFGDRPWLGVGIGNYAAAYARYALPHWYLPLGHAHNVFINFLAETGIVGFSAFMVFWLGVAGLAWRSAVRSSGYQRALGIGLLGMWTYLSVHSMFDNLFVQHIQLEMALLLSILVSIGPAAHTTALVDNDHDRPSGEASARGTPHLRLNWQETQ